MVQIFPSKQQMADAAAKFAAETLREALGSNETVRLVAATGASQLEFLDRLTSANGIDWSRIELFHLDEYVGVGRDHPASFARYIKERIIDRTNIWNYHLLDGMGDPSAVAAEASRRIASAPINLALVGVGENGHLAFNDPPADFEAEQPYVVVRLDQACRQQQVNEGWFPELSAVPQQAISMSVPQILRAKRIVCVVPDERKAHAMRAALKGPVSPQVPASALRIHPDAHIFLDSQSASLLHLSLD
jgi:glucosamine-6-phosphate deaminase